MPSLSNATAWFLAPDGWDLGEIFPWEPITRCQGTFVLLNLALSSVDRCFKQIPT